MADNTQLPVPNTNGDIIATDDISGVKYQRVKLIHGAEVWCKTSLAGSEIGRTIAGTGSAEPVSHACRSSRR